MASSLTGDRVLLEFRAWFSGVDLLPRCRACERPFEPEGQTRALSWAYVFQESRRLVPTRRRAGNHWLPNERLDLVELIVCHVKRNPRKRGRCV